MSTAGGTELENANGAGKSPAEATPGVIEHFFRNEVGRLHGALIRLLGPQNLSLAEDVAQEALLRAMRTWSIGGMPDNPSAWITRVAMNLARDAVRHSRMSQEKEQSIIAYLEQTAPSVGTRVVEENEIRDDRLRLLFVCCHPVISPDAQVILALKVLCGFSTAEIARAFLITETAIEKHLTRTKQRIRNASVGFEFPDGEDLSPRLESVLAALYLLFNEGYKASSGEKLLREELCEEAIRLAESLVSHPVGKSPRTHALLALMLMNAARFPSRLDGDGELLRLDGQDRSQWDAEMIQRGLLHLAQSATGSDVSEYHIEAAIAACHCTAKDYAATDWNRILGLYDTLLRVKPSPVVALNRAVALAHVEGPQAALDAIAEMPKRDRVETHHLLHAVTAELHSRMNNHAAAAESFRRALELVQVGPEQTYLRRVLEQIGEV
jgi:RNA polymerase sigma-70 factor (ECF subfamily)